MSFYIVCDLEENMTGVHLETKQWHWHILWSVKVAFS